MTTTNREFVNNVENTNQPGAAHNFLADILDRLYGSLEIDFSADATLELTQVQCDYGVLVFTDTGPVLTGPQDVEFTAAFTPKLVVNNTAEALTLLHSAGTGVVLAAGDTVLIGCGPDDVIVMAGGGGGLSDAPSDGTNYGRKNGAWEPITGGGGAWFLQFAPRDNEPPTTNYATLDTRNNRPVLDFDTSTQEAAVFSGVLPNDYAGGGVTIDILCAMTSATSGTVGWDVAFERTQVSTDDIDSDSFATAQTVTAVTVPGTSGHVLKLSVNVSDGANMDSLAAGELFRLRVRRDVANDTATGDAELLAVTIREQ